MYANQGGKALELFTAHGRDPLSKLRLTGGKTIKKEFDPIIKGYVISLNGSPATTRIHLPKADKKGLGLDHSFLLLQILVPQDSTTLIELTILDTTNAKCKLHLSQWQQQVSISSLTIKLPLPVPLNQWHWLLVNIDELVSSLSHRQSYHSLEGINICGYCKIRCIAALREGITSVSDIPSSWQPPPSIPLLELVNIDSLAVQSSSIVSLKRDFIPKHVAFGEKIAIPGHVLHSSLQYPSRTGKQLQSIGLKHTDTEILPTRPKYHQISKSVPKSKDPVPNIKPIPEHSISIPEHSIKPIPKHSIPIPEHSIPIPEDSIPDSKPQDLIPKPLELSKQSNIFSYTSPPHSASKQKQHRARKENTLDEDFLSLSITASKGDDENYDWQRYHSSSCSSNEGEEKTPPIDMSLSARIKSGKAVTRTENEDLSHSTSSDDPIHHDTIDSSEMGGPTTPLEHSINITAADNYNEPADNDRLELLYDADLEYFYDPKTGKYYELTN